jgi:hypothetical protein
MKETVLSSVHHLIFDISRHSWFPLHSHRHGVIRRLKVLHDSLLSLFHRSFCQAAAMVCVHDVRCGKPAWRVANLLFPQERAFCIGSGSTRSMGVCGMGCIEPLPLLFFEIGARYIPSDLAGFNICMMHLHTTPTTTTTTTATTTYNLATFCNFQFQPHPPRSRISPGGYCMSVTVRLLCLTRVQSINLSSPINTSNQSALVQEARSGSALFFFFFQADLLTHLIVPCHCIPFVCAC